MEAVKIGNNMLKQKQTNKKNTLNQKHLKVAHVSSFARNLVIWSANVECLPIERLGELCHRMEASSEILILSVYRKPGLILAKTQMIVFPSEVILYIEKIVKLEYMGE
jgi:hypothetical protein